MSEGKGKLYVLLYEDGNKMSTQGGKESSRSWLSVALRDSRVEDVSVKKYIKRFLSSKEISFNDSR